MGLFPFFKHYPGTNLHEIDLDYALREADEAYRQTADLKAWAEEHQEEYEELKHVVDSLVNHLVDVIVPWDSSVEYPIYSIVEYQGTNYIAVQDVPVGAMITNTEYWQPANTVIEQINGIGASVSTVMRTYVRADTCADMKADSTLQAGYTVQTYGYSTTGDGGAALYRIMDTEPAGYYEDITGGLYALLVPVGRVRPEQFGALADGVSDDTAAFNACIESGYPVELSPGKTYRISEGPVMPAGFDMEMNGALVYLTRVDDVYTASWKNFEQSDTDITGYSGRGNISIRNGRFNGPQFLLMHANHVNFENIEFIDGFGHVIQMAGCSNVSIRDCTFKGSTETGLEAVNFDFCEYNSFPFLPSSSPAFDLTGMDGVTVDACRFMPNSANSARAYMDSGVGNHNVLNGHKHTNVVITGCFFQTTRTHAIGAFSAQDWLIADNVFDITGGYPVEYGDGLYVVIQGNSFGGNGYTPAAAIKQSTQRSYSMSIFGNTYRKNVPTKLYDGGSMQCSFVELQPFDANSSDVGAYTFTLPAGMAMADISDVWITFNSAANGTYIEHHVRAFYGLFTTGQVYSLGWDPVMSNAKLTINDNGFTVSADSGVQPIRHVRIGRPTK